MMKKVVGIRVNSNWLLKFQLKRSAKKVENFQPFFPATFFTLFSDIAQSCLNCACTQENLGTIFSLPGFFSWMKNGLNITFLCWKTRSPTFYCSKRKKRQFVWRNLLVENRLNDEFYWPSVFHYIDWKFNQ